MKALGVTTDLKETNCKHCAERKTGQKVKERDKPVDEGVGHERSCV